MKSFNGIKLIGLIAFALVLSIATYAKKVIGSGNVVKENRTTEAFTNIKCQGVFDVYLSQGEKELVEVEADDNIQQYIITEFRDGMLVVKNKEGINFRNNPKMKIYITVIDLKKLDYSGVGKLECITHLNLENLKLINNGVGTIKLKGKVKEFTVRNNGVGSIKAFDFKAQKVDLKNSGVGNVKINATTELKIINNGVGSVDYTGGAELIDIESNGIGGVHKK